MNEPFAIAGPIGVHAINGGIGTMGLSNGVYGHEPMIGQQPLGIAPIQNPASIAVGGCSSSIFGSSCSIYSGSLAQPILVSTAPNTSAPFIQCSGALGTNFGLQLGATVIESSWAANSAYSETFGISHCSPAATPLTFQSSVACEPQLIFPSHIANTQLFHHSSAISWLRSGDEIFSSFEAGDRINRLQLRAAFGVGKSNFLTKVRSILQDWATIDIDASAFGSFDINNLFLSNTPHHLNVDIKTTLSFEDINEIWMDLANNISDEINTHVLLLKFTKELSQIILSASFVIIVQEIVRTKPSEPSRFDEIRHFLVRSSVSPPNSKPSDHQRSTLFCSVQRKRRSSDDYLTRRAYRNTVSDRRRPVATTRCCRKGAAASRLVGRGVTASRYRGAQRPAVPQVSWPDGLVRSACQRQMVDSISVGAPQLQRSLSLPKEVGCDG
jgi:hypothetical protein